MEENIKLRCILELMARPKEMAVNALKSIIDKIEENGKKLEISNVKYSEPKEVENDFFSAYAEFEIQGDFDSLFNFVLDYAPSSIEVIEPSKIILDMATLQTSLKDYIKFYMNRRVSVIILRGKDILLVKLKDIDKALPRSSWVFPFLELGENESPRKAFNDLLHEFGINYSIRKEIFKYTPSENPKLLYIVYVVDYIGGEPDVSKRFQTYKWVPINEITTYSTSFMDANISRYLNEIYSSQP